MRRIGEVIDYCTKMRALPKEFRHRVIYEFGLFLVSMVNYLIFNVQSNYEDIREFQLKINRNDYDPEDINTYIELFRKYCEEVNE